MLKIKRILNAIMSVCLGYYVGHCIFVFWKHYRYPEIYAMQSAPWYTSLWVNGLMVLAIMLICTIAKIILKYIDKKKNP